MTHQRDIIEVVKELQAKSCECDKYEMCYQCVKRAEAFHSIAQALLIAVEALENIERKEAIECHFMKEGTALPPTPATDALKRIRSLPSA